MYRLDSLVQEQLGVERSYRATTGKTAIAFIRISNDDPKIFKGTVFK